MRTFEPVGTLAGAPAPATVNGNVGGGMQRAGWGYSVGASSSGAGSDAPELTVLDAEAGQTIFALPALPSTDADGTPRALMRVGGLTLTPGTHFTVAGQVLTYTLDVALDAGDKVTLVAWPGAGPELTVVEAEAGQTEFALSHVPSTDSSGDPRVEMSVAGVSLTLGVHFTIDGQTLTYTGDVALEAGDLITLLVWR